MFKRSFRSQDQTQSRVEKATRLKRSGSIRDPTKLSKLQRSLTEQDSTAPKPPKKSTTAAAAAAATSATATAPSPSPIVTLTVGRDGRLFAAHEDVLRQSPFFEAALRSGYRDAQSRRISLPDEEPEAFSALLEYLYKGDYYPRLLHNRNRNSWELEDQARTPHTSPIPENGGGRAGTGAANGSEATVFLSSVNATILRDTVIYCAADRYGLEELKRLALRKQGLQAGIDVATILRSAQYAYAHTPDSDSRLRAHYLALIIRCRKTFKRSGTMQAEMEAGGSKLFFDLFVAMCNHLDDVIDVSNARTPRTV
ncbi:hypothetical protein AK830_g4387 [Neonectria ditissima]|uniref:BTB domain-containing protein n=1 Tax=Neonectria ditissima TaxID=78410 RepID=A0A0P7AW11_9HYPO|nr:hypothetical protein AK830_g4387 [Neonectria ditissima]